MDGATTYYVGNYYEYCSTGAAKKYYYHAGKRIAMVEGSTKYWLLSDHLGSTTVTVRNDTLLPIAETRYRAYGKTLSPYTYGATPTTYRFTGQREEADIRLYYYGARWYDPALGRFVQADTIVPEPGNPQALNRYSYCLNDPINHTDPSGYITKSEAKDADDIWALLRDYYDIWIHKDWEWGFLDGDMVWQEGGWDFQQLKDMRDEVKRLGAAMGGYAKFRSAVGGRIDISRNYQYKPSKDGGWTSMSWNSGSRRVSVFNTDTGDAAVHPGSLTHELAHAWDDNRGLSGQMRTLVESRDELKRYDFSSEYAWSRRGEPWEDFAEAVAGHFRYPASYRTTERSDGLPMSPYRGNFVLGALEVEARAR